MERIGRYEILEQVGRGSMGVVYRAHDTVLEREVALKVLWEDFCDDEAALARFQREARAVARLTHRNIVTLYELGQQEDGRPYIAMEFLRGAPLDKRMRMDPPLSLIERIDIVAQLCAGLHFAHEQGVVHRDVKPANIWVQPDGGVKLVDFGIARLASSSITRDGNVLGTASYMAPEQIEGGPIDGRADIFAAGVVLYELLAGHRPFEADSPTGVIARILRGEYPPLDPDPEHLPPPLTAATARALARRPQDRFATAAEFAAELVAVRRSLEHVSLGAESLILGAGTAVKAMTLGASPSLTLPRAVTIGTTSPTGVDSAGTADAAAVGAPASTAPAPRGQTHRRSVWHAVAAAVAVLLAGAGGWVWATRPTRQPAPRSAATPAPAAAEAPQATASLPVQPAASPSAVRQVEVISEPAGATVAFEGRSVPGATPLRVDVPVGEADAEIVLTRPGFEPERVRLTAEHVQAGRIEVRLRPAVARVGVVLSGSYPFEVYAGARLISAAGSMHRVTVDEGQQLRVRAPAYFLDARVTVRRGADGTMRYAAPGLGSLSVRSVVENCDLLIDGLRTDPPPLYQRPIVEGTHVVELRCGDGIERRRAASVTAGRDELVRFTRE